MHAIHAPRIQLDPSRIASISGAIAVHVGVLLLMIAPMAPVVRAVQDTTITFVDPIPVTPPPPPPPPQDPIHVEVHQAPAPVTPQPTHVDPPPLPAEDTRVGDIPMPPITSDKTIADAGTVSPPRGSGPPLTGAHLEYAANPAPAYPSSSLRAQEEGVVLLEVLVDVDGHPIDVKISRSSGSRALDAAARRQVLANWLFRPAMRDGVAVQAIGLVPVEFKLE